LQYGVTRDSLREALEDGEGWDVIHFSGHGMPGSLVLETPEGQPDLVSSTEVGKLLLLTGQRLKLVTLSACLSAAASIQQTLARLGETEAAAQRDAVPCRSCQLRGRGEGRPNRGACSVQQARLCVLAMRYAVEAEFATALPARSMRACREKQPLPQALQLALGKALGGAGAAAQPAPAAGALSLATPALFGAQAADLRLVPRRGA